MNILNKIKTILNDDSCDGFDPRLDEFDYTIEGEFLFDNEKYQIIFFYNHILNISYTNEPPNIDLAISALNEDKISFFKLLSYLRDVKGLGNKETFRYFIKHLANEYSNDFKKYINFIPKFGRYDDLYAFFDTDIEEDVIKLFKLQLEVDKTSDSPSNLAKWLKSTNASNLSNNILGKRTAKLLDLNYKEYRQLLSSLRKKMHVVETFMSSNEWESIQYGSLTKRNISKYHNAFLKHDLVRYSEFLKLNLPTTSKLDHSVFSPLIEKQNYLKILKNSLEKDISLDEYSKIVKSFYRKLTIKKETWLPIVLLKDNPNLNADSYDNISTFSLESIFLSLFCLCNNSHYYQNYIIKSSGNPVLKRISQTTSLNDIFNLISVNSISNSISIESVFDLLLLSHIKKITLNIPTPDGIILVLQNSSIITEYQYENICSSGEKIALLYSSITQKWLEYSIPTPKIKIWIIEDTPKPMILDPQNKNILIIRGNGEAAFKCLLNQNIENKVELTYTELKDNLINVLIDERYSFCSTFNL